MSEGAINVLVVDDEEGVRNLLIKALEEAGYTVAGASNGQEALNKMSEQEIWVVLLDVKMPGISGIKVLQQITADWPDVCMVMVTGVGEAETAVEAMKQGACDYITKPFNVDDVVMRVQRAAERRALLLQSKRHQLHLERNVREQAERLQTQFVELVQNMAREHRLLFELEALRRSRGAVSLLPSLPPELQKPISSVEDFKDALLRILRRGKVNTA